MIPKIKTGRYTAVLVAALLPAYFVAMHIGITQRHAAEQFAAEGDRLRAEFFRTQLFAATHGGLYPPLDATHRTFSFAPDGVPESYTFGKSVRFGIDDSTKPIIFGALAGEKALALKPLVPSEDYFYLGYAITSEAEGLALVDAVKQGVPPTDDITVGPGKGTLGMTTLYHLRESLAAYLVAVGVQKDPNALTPDKIPVLIQRPKNNHLWVIYLDHHPAELPYPGPFPATEKFINALEAAGK